MLVNFDAVDVSNKIFVFYEWMHRLVIRTHEQIFINFINLNVAQFVVPGEFLSYLKCC